MSSSLTVTYKGNTLHTSTEDETFVLNTSGKYMEDDITITAGDVSSIDVSYNSSSLISESSATNTWTLNTAGKLMEDDVSFDVTLTPPPYITFSSPSSFTLQQQDQTTSSAVIWNGTVEYSTDKSSWTVWNGKQISSVNNVIYLRGTGNTNITGSSGKRFILLGTSIRCSGNIENLLDYTTVLNGGHPSMAAQCFQSLFYQNTSLVSAPQLPALSLAVRCYESMFSGCTSLVDPPTLPASVVVAGCYTGMFANCTSLAHLPSLPATLVPRAAYEGMFKGCTSLVDNIDLRHVTSITTDESGPILNIASGYIAPNAGVSTLYSSALTTVAEKAFLPLTYESSTVSNYFYFTDNDPVLFDATYLVTVGNSDKGTITNDIYTDNTTIKNAVLTKVDEYTIVNVYHLDGSVWS